jgi:hypothetical protein
LEIDIKLVTDKIELVTFNALTYQA